jgi:hypothetical protein
MAAIKAMSMKSGIKKKEIFKHEYNPKYFDNTLSTVGNYIHVIEKMRTPSALFRDLHNRLSVGNYKWIAIDYLQIIKGERYQDSLDKINQLDSYLLELNKEFCIPIIRLSQAPKSAVVSNDILGIGSEKGSGDIAQNSRYAISINPSVPDEGTISHRLISVYKTTFRRRCQVKCSFVGETGKLDYAEVIDAGS